MADRVVFEATGLRHTFRRRRAQPRTALDGLTLTLRAGEWVALLGPNGSGKSTLMRAVSGLLACDEGELEVFGEAPGSRSNRSRVGVVFQSPGLDKLLTVRENLQTQGALFSLPDVPERIGRVAELLELQDRLDDRVGGLSGGLARRADLARALLADPELLLLDEPTVGLDPAARSSFFAAIDALRQERPQLALLHSTHLMIEAEQSSRVVMMRAGALVADGSPSGLRSELGGTQLRLAADDASALSRTDLVLREAGDEILVTGEPEEIARAVATMLERGIQFTSGPPSLGDVYLSKTGAALQSAEGGDV